MPGSPSPEGRKPGICQTGQLVTRKGPEGSNPSPGAYFEEPSTSLKVLAGESRVEEETTAMDDGLTVNITEQSKLDGIIDSITQAMSRKALNTRLKMLYRISPSNASTICEHILSEQTERNIKTSTAENKVKAPYCYNE
jgi:hypothetical protein